MRKRKKERLTKQNEHKPKQTAVTAHTHTVLESDRDAIVTLTHTDWT
jgi:hypothetical protein